MAHILIVDDEPDTQRMLDLLMEREGHTTRAASNGWEALLALGDHHFDLILLDMMLPGLDGEKFLTILRKSVRDGNVPVVVVTALDSEVARSRIGNNRVEDIVVKKPDRMIQDLIAKVRIIVGP